jgi:cytoskeletal protein CcmA (bactofilin family)
MFGKKKLDLSKLNSIIAKGMTVSGAVTFEGTMKLSGEMKGSSIKPNEDDSAQASAETILIIEGKATCNQIVADHIIITGTVKADQLIANKSLIVISGGKMFVDDVQYGSMTTDETANISATLKKITDTAEKAQK